MLGGVAAQEGPPPRGRGRLGEDPGRPVIHRATPARAGTTGLAAGELPVPAGYPRAGGDDLQIGGEFAGAVGPPPRGRGRPGRPAEARRVVRATPARAGTTWSRVRAATHAAGYPRAGGDDPCRLPGRQTGQGATPA